VSSLLYYFLALEKTLEFLLLVVAIGGGAVDEAAVVG
jgi:hypothetical protein